MRENIAYARQSFQRPNRESSTTGQIEAITQYALEHDIPISRTFSDISSGKNLNRPKIQHIIKMIEENKVHKIIVWRLDRLSRNSKELLDFFALCETFEVEIISINDNVLPYKNASDKFKMQVLASISELQRNIISENKLLANEAKFNKGLTLNHEAPFGYRYENKKFIIEKDEAETVKHVFNLYLQGSGYKKISQQLSRQTHLINRTPAQVRYILINIKYAGHYRSEKYGVIENALPAIISMEVFVSAEKFRKSKQKDKKVRVKHNLAQKIPCPICGKNMTTYHHRKQTNSTPKYVCSVKLSGQYDDCPMKFIPIKQVEYAVLNAIKRFLCTPSELDQIHQRMMFKIKGIKRDYKQSDVTLNLKREQLISKLANGDITLEIFKEKNSILQKSLRTSRRNLDDKKITIEKLLNIIQNDPNLNTTLFQMVRQVQLDKNGQLKGLYLNDINQDILNITVKEYIEHDIKFKNASH